MAALTWPQQIAQLGEMSPEDSVSPAGARGSMQVLDSTAASPGFGVAPARDSSLAERDRVGRDYAEALRQYYGGNQVLASAAYNAGPGRVQQWLQEFGDPRVPGGPSSSEWAQKIPYDETRNYVARVTGGAAGLAPDDERTQIQLASPPTGVPAGLAEPGAAWQPPPPPAGDASGGNPLLGAGASVALPLLAAGWRAVPVTYDPFKVMPKGLAEDAPPGGKSALMALPDYPLVPRAGAS